jgi:Tol biopolymer transport system component
VAYVSFPEGDLWRCRLDGSEKQQLTSAPLFVFSASWSPDGHQLALAAAEPGKPSRLHLIPADGGSPRELPVGELYVNRVSWASDGKSINFQDISRPESSFIRSVDIETLRVATLPGSEQLQIPVRSPNGRYLVAITVDGQKLMLFDFASQKWSEVASMSVGFTQWSTDSNYVYFDTGYSADPAVYRVRITDEKLERIASLKDFRRAVTGFVTWSGLTPDGSPLLMRDTGTQEVYALDLETP